MAEETEQALRLLHQYVDGGEFEEEIREAREDFFNRVGKPLPGEELEETRLASFIEWFIFDRQSPKTGLTPLERFLREKHHELSLPLLEVLKEAVRNIHSLFLVVSCGEDSADLKDLYTGLKYERVKRIPLTLCKGDIVELRLVRGRDGYFATDGVCYHPPSARKVVERLCRKGRKQGYPVHELALDLMAANTRYHHYPKTAKQRAYEEALKTLPRVSGSPQDKRDREAGR